MATPSTTATSVAKDLTSGGGTPTSPGTGTSGGGTSTSASAINAPVLTGTGSAAANLSQGAEAARKFTEQQAIEGKYSDVDATNISQLKQQQDLAAAQKGVAGLSFVQKLGDVRKQIAQQQFAAQDKEAASGFIGSGARDRAQIALNQQVDNTLGSQESAFTNQLRNLNATIGTARQSELQSLRPELGAGVVNQALTTGQDIFGTKSDQGFLGHLGGLFGKDQTSHGTIDEGKFKANTQIQGIMQELGLNPNSPDSLQQLNDAAKKAITTERSSSWDTDTKITINYGNGEQAISHQQMSLGRAIGAEVLNVVGIAGLALPFIPVVGDVAAAGVESVTGALEGAIGESIEGVIGEVTANLGSTMADILPETAGATSVETAGLEGGVITGDAANAVGQSITGAIGSTVQAQAGQTVGTTALESFGEEQLTSLSQSLSEGVEQLFGDQAANLPTDAVNASMNMAKETVTELLNAMGGVQGLSPELLSAVQKAGFASVEDLTMDDVVSIATSNALDILENSDIVSAVGSATADATTDVAGTTAAGGAQETATTQTTDAAAANLENQAPESIEPPQEQQGGIVGRSKQLLSKFKGKATAAGTPKGPVSTAFQEVAKFAPRVAWRGTKAALTTDLGSLAWLSSAAATEISNVMDKMKISGLTDAQLQKVGTAMLEQEANKQGQ